MTRTLSHQYKKGQERGAVYTQAEHAHPAMNKRRSQAASGRTMVKRQGQAQNLGRPGKETIRGSLEQEGRQQGRNFWGK